MGRTHSAVFAARTSSMTIPKASEHAPLIYHKHRWRDGRFKRRSPLYGSATFFQDEWYVYQVHCSRCLAGASLRKRHCRITTCGKLVAFAKTARTPARWTLWSRIVMRSAITGGTNSRSRLATGTAADSCLLLRYCAKLWSFVHRQTSQPRSRRIGIIGSMEIPWTAARIAAGAVVGAVVGLSLMPDLPAARPACNDNWWFIAMYGGAGAVAGAVLMLSRDFVKRRTRQ